jgi:DNA-binding NarL/FixJ family response regulator
MSMPAHHSAEPVLTPELEAIATAAANLLRAQAVDGTEDRDELHAYLRATATQAIASGAELDAIAQAQRHGHERARRELGGDLLRRVERAARRRRESEREYEDVVVRAARLGLAQRAIAAAANVAHGTVRAILTRSRTVTDNGHAAEQQLPDSEPDEIAA